MIRSTRLKGFWMKHKLTAHLKVLIIVIITIMFVTPLRNALVPGWPRMLRQLNTLKVIRVHLEDLFYNVDRTPYDGPCDFVHQRLTNIKMPKLEEMPVYDINEWYHRVASIKPKLTLEQQAILDNYKPSLTPKEQREMLFAMLSVTQALAAFNITYSIAEGSLIGYWRHHGLIPWDDDVDIIFDRNQWPLVKQVLSCLPGLELNMGPDYMWKLFYKDSDLWKGETTIRFPFIDLFMYRHDDDYLWPVCIWMKTEVLIPMDWFLPVTHGIFEGYPVLVPAKPSKVLDLHFGPVSEDCYSRTFLRRERYLVPVADRTHLPCQVLESIYPFVSRTLVDRVKGMVFEERKIGAKVLSTFNATYHKVLE